MPQARPIEVIWTILERKIYENNWQANNIDHLVRRIKQKNQRIRSTNVARHDGRSPKKASAYMARWAIFDLLNMFFCSIFHALSNRKKNIFVSIEMITLCNSTFFQRLLHRLLFGKLTSVIFSSFFFANKSYTVSVKIVQLLVYACTNMVMKETTATYQ